MWLYWSLIILSLNAVPVHGQVRRHFQCSNRRLIFSPNTDATSITTDVVVTYDRSTPIFATTTMDDVNPWIYTSMTIEGKNVPDDATTTTTDTNTQVFTTRVADGTSKQTTVIAADTPSTTKAERGTTMEVTTPCPAHDRQNHQVGGRNNCTGLADCQEIHAAGCIESGIYDIVPADWTGAPFRVYCNMTSINGSPIRGCAVEGWTVFQRRINGSVDFYRDWTSYKEGFGNLDHEFWLGNVKLHYLTKQGTYDVRIDLVTQVGKHYYAHFLNFSIDDETANFKLNVEGWNSGTSGDGLLNQNGDSFSTLDADHDQSISNCALNKEGAWWYKNCANANLNGNYFAVDGEQSIFWHNLPPEERYHIKFTEMKIRKTLE